MESKSEGAKRLEEDILSIKQEIRARSIQNETPGDI